ncbi:PQ loop repeat protein [Metarhizium rileyi]|uniref:PQ loop repeat protein n=1 Tax=Metarhizium rileyi (strain RCEF 4871) TaxID=1649241 RepID=A0A167KNW3_METRR|nr:PQ loop repeat protein [Metarhizium rileyi RCEF 4871]TWU77598.1 hypothetical protein ED733_007848 [Metarhizium rileyi]
MTWLTDLTGFIAPFFIIMSPVISYGDQILAMQRNKSSDGFSLDIPLIMLVASFFRIFYWPGSRFDASLLVQSFLMVAVQLILLKIALEHKPLPATKGGEGSIPFSGLKRNGPFEIRRPYNFWQWRSHKPYVGPPLLVLTHITFSLAELQSKLPVQREGELPLTDPRRYWHFLLYLLGGLVVCEVLLRPLEPIYDAYSVLIGYLGLSIEATLPIPQLIAHAQSHSCKGFRLSVLASWIGGDAMKVFWFFTSTSEIPLAFKVCGCFQAACDCLLGVQYFMYGANDNEAILREHAMEEAHWARGHGASHSHARSTSAGKRGARFSDTEAD